MQITITIDGAAVPVFEPTDQVEPLAHPLPLATMDLYRDLAAAALHAVEASSQLHRTDFPVGMLMPVDLFDLLVNIAGKVEAADPTDQLSPVAELTERHWN